MDSSFAAAVKTCFSKYADFSGRAARPEFWFFVLFCVVVQLVLQLLGSISISGASILSGLFSLAVLVPSLAAGARRLHDIDKSGWLQLLALIPIVGAIILIYFWAQPGTPGTNRFA